MGSEATRSIRPKHTSLVSTVTGAEPECSAPKRSCPGNFYQTSATPGAVLSRPSSSGDGNGLHVYWMIAAGSAHKYFTSLFRDGEQEHRQAAWRRLHPRYNANPARAGLY